MKGRRENRLGPLFRIAHARACPTFRAELLTVQGHFSTQYVYLVPELGWLILEYIPVSGTRFSEHLLNLS